MALKKTVVQDAIAVNKDKVQRGRAICRLVDNNRLAKPPVFLAYMPNGVQKSRLVAPDYFFEWFIGTIVRDEYLKVPERLIRQARKNHLKGLSAIVNGNNQRQAGNFL